MILLKLFISGNERGHTTDAPERMSGTFFTNVNKSMIPEEQKNNYTMMYYEATFYSRHTSS